MTILGIIYCVMIVISLSYCQSYGHPCVKEGSMVESDFNCKQYYKCIDGKFQNETCSWGYNFDYKKKECRWSLLAHCKPSPDAMDGQPCSRDGDIIASETDCKNYYVCTNGKLKMNVCGFWKSFDIIKNECRWSFLSTCRKDNKEIKPCSKDGEVIASSSNCKEYYKCVNGEYIKQMCGIGQKFDVKMNDCIWSFDATCRNSTFQPIRNKRQINQKAIPSDNSETSDNPTLFCSLCNHGQETTGVIDHCQYYCRCINGKADGNPKKCSFDNYYNTKLQECTPNKHVCGNTPSSLPQGSHCKFVGDKLKLPSDCNYYLECSEKEDKTRKYELKSCGFYVFDKETKTCRFNLAVQQSFPFFYYRCTL